MSNYYVSHNNQVDGPFTLEQIEQAVRSRQYLLPPLVCQEGEDVWLPFGVAKTKAAQGQKLDHLKPNLTPNKSTTRPAPAKLESAPPAAVTAEAAATVVATIVAAVVVLLGLYQVLGGWSAIDANNDLVSAAAKLRIWSGIWLLFGGLLTAFCLWLAAQLFAALRRIEKQLGK
ncbi:MAG: DUF4339 domain-containing protein [Verrucomicrobiales bacterium]|jgi:hypothetical protein|nr:DUF4339 domain-containing protein [Verrucomicrobiales bacterium]